MSIGTDETAYYRRLGRALAELREATGRTREEAAARIGTTYQTLGRWERGESTITAWTVALLAELYGLGREHYHELLDPPEPVNRWRGRLTSDERDALEWASSPERLSRRAQDDPEPERH